jgi:hypothetical protein
VPRQGSLPRQGGPAPAPPGREGLCRCAAALPCLLPSQGPTLAPIPICPPSSRPRSPHLLPEAFPRPGQPPARPIDDGGGGLTEAEHWTIPPTPWVAEQSRRDGASEPRPEMRLSSRRPFARSTGTIGSPGGPRQQSGGPWRRERKRSARGAGSAAEEAADRRRRRRRRRFDDEPRTTGDRPAGPGCPLRAFFVVVRRGQLSTPRLTCSVQCSPARLAISSPCGPGMLRAEAGKALRGRGRRVIDFISPKKRSNMGVTTSH